MNEYVTKEAVARTIGKRAVWEPEPGIKFDVEVYDAKIAYGVPHYFIRPVAGSGTRRVKLNIEIIN